MDDPDSGGPGGLFGGMFGRGGAARAVADAGWLRAMLEVEAALARAEASAGIISAQTAAAIGRACRIENFDAAALGAVAGASAGPVPPLVAALREHLAAGADPGPGGGAEQGAGTGEVPGTGRGADAAAAVHHGATSQDVLDTAAMLVTRRALASILADLSAVAAECAALARRHRDTVMAGRTLLQQAVPTTFGLKAATWLSAVTAAASRLRAIRDGGLAVQLGGAAGTLSALGERGTTVAGLLAAELELAEPALPWHTDRTRVAELAGALGTAAGTLGKIATDLVLLAQTEVAEVAEAAPGGSSAMPHKRNPVAAICAAACARRTPGLVATLLAAMPQEHERAAGGWQAEWEPLSELLRITGSAAAWVAAALDGLTVDADRMRANLERSGGLPMAERVVAAAGGGPAAREAVTAACARAAADGRTLREVLIEDPALGMTAREVDETLDPRRYLGSAYAFVDRALTAYTVYSRYAADEEKS